MTLRGQERRARQDARGDQLRLQQCPLDAGTKEAERLRRQTEHDRADQQRRYEEAGGHYADRVLSFRQWCEINGISHATGRRIINAGNGPTAVQLSARRIGVTVRANREWQVARGSRAIGSPCSGYTSDR
jgi:predicted DNA-binding transcriptional regulator AlpA